MQRILVVGCVILNFTDIFKIRFTHAQQGNEVAITAPAYICFLDRFSANSTSRNRVGNAAFSKISHTIPITDAAGIRLSVN